MHYTDLVQQWVLDKIDGPIVLPEHSLRRPRLGPAGRWHLPRARRRPHGRPRPAAAGVVAHTASPLEHPDMAAGPGRHASARRAERASTGTPEVRLRDYLAAGPLRPSSSASSTKISPSAQSIAVPTLLIWGTDDTETPPWLAERYKSLIGGRTTLELLPHKDHHLYAGTGAHLCAEKIRGWLDVVTDA